MAMNNTEWLKTRKRLLDASENSTDHTDEDKLELRSTLDSMDKNPKFTGASSPIIESSKAVWSSCANKLLELNKNTNNLKEDDIKAQRAEIYQILNTVRKSNGVMSEQEKIAFRNQVTQELSESQKNLQKEPDLNRRSWLQWASANKKKIVLGVVLTTIAAFALWPVVLPALALAATAFVGYLTLAAVSYIAAVGLFPAIASLAGAIAVGFLAWFGIKRGLDAHKQNRVDKGVEALSKQTQEDASRELDKHRANIDKEKEQAKLDKAEMALLDAQAAMLDAEDILDDEQRTNDECKTTLKNDEDELEQATSDLENYVDTKLKQATPGSPLKALATSKKTLADLNQQYMAARDNVYKTDSALKLAEEAGGDPTRVTRLKKSLDTQKNEVNNLLKKALDEQKKCDKAQKTVDNLTEDKLTNPKDKTLFNRYSHLKEKQSHLNDQVAVDKKKLTNSNTALKEAGQAYTNKLNAYHDHPAYPKVAAKNVAMSSLGNTHPNPPETIAQRKEKLAQRVQEKNEREQNQRGGFKR